MNTMGNLAQGILIGDNAVAAFLDIAVNKQFGRGLFHETTRGGYRKFNFMNNFPRMTSYYDIQSKLSEKPITSKRYFFGNLVNAHNVDEIPIGWSYSTDINHTRLNRGFTSSADFDIFQSLLREEQLFKADLNDESKFTYMKYSTPNIGIELYDKKQDGGITPLYRGDIYQDRPENFRRNHKTIVEITNRDVFNKLPKISDSIIIHGSDIFKKIPLGKIIGDYGDLFNLNTLKYNPKENHLSLYYNYRLDGIKTGYAVDDYKWGTHYIINQTATEKVNDIIDTEIKVTKDNKGTLSNFNVTNLSRSYTYFDEPKDNSKNFNGSKRTSLGFVASLVDDSFDETNSSKLLKRTNDLFKNDKINSLINRFHTKATGVGVDDSELITARTKEYGLSRGRNLLKKNHRNNGGPYTNPYCRVWTAHHQYAHLQDRIRPFIDENENYLGIQELHSGMGDGLRPNNAPERLSTYGVLQNNGFVKITPFKDDFNDKTNIEELERKKIMNYMFSIENLAWKDVLTDSTTDALSPGQKGPNNGRIMWFPPYNLKFTENVNVDWNSNKFIGRGEQIYTYTNTERAGTLSFTLLIDHPSILNTWRGNSGDFAGEEMREKEETMLRFFAGCEPLEGVTSISNEKILKKDEAPEVSPNIEPKPTTQYQKIAYVVFFPNNYSGYDDIKNVDITKALEHLSEYETSTSGTWNSNKEWVEDDKHKSDKEYKDQILLESNKLNHNKFALNKGGVSFEEIKQILLGTNDEYLDMKFLVANDENDLIHINLQDTGDSVFGYLKTNAKIDSVDIYGFASSHGYEKSNRQLVARRTSFMDTILKKYCSFYDPNIPVRYRSMDGTHKTNGIITVNNKDGRGDVNAFDAKVARAAVLVFNVKRNVDSVPVNTKKVASGITVNGLVLDKIEKIKPIKSEFTQTVIKNTKDVYRHDTEYLYFSKIAQDDLMVKNIINRVRHFDPAFHSITPEGFNSRLTFLHQCTRQGPTTAVNGGQVSSRSTDYLKYAGNLAFGRAPYCILRIGDFFNTKILIDSISIDYDNGGGTQWDLNPEGAGVQPMLANVNINFKFIGGQDISGPIERLQNAITSNYYANASVYDKNADYQDADGNVIRNDLMI